MIMTTNPNGVVSCEMFNGRVGTIHKLERAYVVKYDGQEELAINEQAAIRWMQNKEIEERNGGQY